MRLYHGSYTAVEQPETTKGREKVDFGQGFYLTNIQSQAEKWSKVIAIRKGPKYQPVVSVFELDEDVFTCKDFRIKTFEKYDIEWLQYVVVCRKGSAQSDCYDLVEGALPTTT